MRKRVKKEITGKQALERMMVLCSRSEQCSFDVKMKLLRIGVGNDEIKKIIQELKKGGFIDDLRFARAYSYTKMVGNGWGRKKIRLGLYQKRISSEIITEACACLDEEEYRKILGMLAQVKARNLDLSLFEDRQKLFKSLYARGFETEIIKEAIKSLIKEKTRDD